MTRSRTGSSWNSLISTGRSVFPSMLTSNTECTPAAESAWRRSRTLTTIDSVSEVAE